VSVRPTSDTYRKDLPKHGTNSANQQLKAQNEIVILLGFLLMFLSAFGAFFVQQMRLRENLEEMQARNTAMLTARRAYQRSLEAMQAENNLRVKLLQKRKFNTIQL